MTIQLSLSLQKSVGARLCTRVGPIVGLMVTLLVPISPAGAQPTARQYLERRHEEVNRLLRRPARTDAARRRRSTELARLLGELVDYQTLSQQALGEHWAQRSASEREHFVSLLRQLVERNYESNLERTLEFEISYGQERASGGRTVVPTMARSRRQRRQPPVEIDYTMRQEGNAWHVVDVTTDGVSMVQNYRRQFGRIIGRNGWGELISRMEQRLAEQNAESAGQ